MPYISVKTNQILNNSAQTELKSALGSAISIIPGKSEQWLMVSIEDSCKLYFKGENDDPIAYIEVKIFGKADAEDYNNLTAELCRIMDEQLGVAPDHTYVKYEECSIWGWNGSNF